MQRVEDGTEDDVNDLKGVRLLPQLPSLERCQHGSLSLDAEDLSANVGVWAGCVYICINSLIYVHV